MDQAIVHWHLFSKETGHFTGTSSSGPPGTCPDSVEGFAWFEGEVDVLSQRLVLTDASPPVLIDYQPPAPSEDHAWDPTTKRYSLRPAVQARRDAQALATAEIQRQELAAQRPVRELLLALQGAGLLTRPEDLANLARLQKADAAIAAERPALAAAK